MRWICQNKKCRHKWSWYADKDDCPKCGAIHKFAKARRELQETIISEATRLNNKLGNKLF